MLATSTENERDIFRVIIVRRAGTEVLLIPDGNRFRLPSVSIPRCQRVAENLTAAVKSEWGQKVVCLFTLDHASAEVRGDQVHYQVGEHRQTGATRGRTQWVAEAGFSPNLFADQSDYKAVRHSMAICRDETLNVEPGPFARPGWFKELYQWVEAVIEREGFHLNGEFRQLNASPTFSLIRFETDGPVFWFKAVGEPNQREFPITRTLAGLFPDYVPPIVAERPDWNGWLTKQAEGTNLDETQECALWEAAAAALAEIQIESIGHREQILASGAHDLRTESLADLIQPFMETMELLMDQKTKIPPAILGRAELAVLGKRVQDVLDVLTSFDIPNTLGHLDLNPGNILVSGTQCAFLDWAEAYVGHPFLSLQYLLEHGRRAHESNAVVEARLVESYRERWERVVSRSAIDVAFELTPLLAVFAYAAGTNLWRDPERPQHPATAGYVRSLTRRMNREAELLEARRSVCAQ